MQASPWYVKGMKLGMAQDTRLRAMGAEPEVSGNQFFSELDSMRNQLVDAYTEKSKIIADREVVRFKYLTTWKIQFEACANACQNKVFSEMDASLTEIWSAMYHRLCQAIPMSTLTGGYANPAPGNKGYNNNGLFLSSSRLMPLDTASNLLENIGTAQSPYYTYRNVSQEQASTANIPLLMDQYFWKSNQITFPIQLVPTNDYRGGFSFENGYGASAATQALPISEKLSLLARLSNIMMTNYTGYGSLEAVVNNGEVIFKDVLIKTLRMIITQHTIDALEKNVGDYIQGMRDSGAITEAQQQSSSTLEQLQMLARAENEKQLAAQMALDAKNANQPALPSTEGLITPAVTAGPEKKSKLPMILGAVAIGAVVLMNKE